jgi:hypothetical protein
LPALHLHADSKSVTNTQKVDCFIELVLGDWAAKKYIAFIDELPSELHPLIAHNAARWPNNGEYYTDANDFNAEVQLLRDWLEKREPAVNSFVIESQ